MQIARLDQPKSEVVLTITIPSKEVEEAYQKTLEKLGQEVEIKGFRKGKAPLNLVEKEIGKKKILEETLKTLIPEIYSKALKQEDIHPIAPPKAELISLEEDKDWVIKFTICLKPKVNLKNYKKAISDLKASKRPKIIVPGQKEPTPPTLDELLKTLLAESEVEISDLLIGDETNRLLANLIDQLQKLGLTVDQYLASKNTTVENLREDYLNQARDTLKLEFILEEIANSENVQVSSDDIKKAIEAIKDEKEKEVLSKNNYYLASLLRRQKTLDYLEKL